MSTTGKVLTGVLVGAAVGATLGILFAPDKGVNTRRKISQKSREYSDEFTHKFNEFIESITKKFDEMKEEAAKKLQNGQPDAKVTEKIKNEFTKSEFAK